MSLNIVWKLIKPIIIFSTHFLGFELNPHTLEWGEHYIIGSKRDKELPKSLVPFTKDDVLYALCGDKKHKKDIKSWWGAICQPYKGGNSWFTHPTQGVVGGFAFRLKSWEKEFVFECIDTWDFNQVDYNIPLPTLPKCIISVLVKILERCGIQIVMENGHPCISEKWLSQFNEGHSFNTRWSVYTPNNLTCSLKGSPFYYRYKDRTFITVVKDSYYEGIKEGFASAEPINSTRSPIGNLFPIGDFAYWDDSTKEVIPTEYEELEE